MPYLEIGAAPCDEPCEQANVVGSSYERMRHECSLYVGQLLRQFGAAPEGARLSVKHMADGDSGYYEVVCYYDHNFPESVMYAYNLEAHAPANWDDEAKKMLDLVPPGRQS